MWLYERVGWDASPTGRNTNPYQGSMFILKKQGGSVGNLWAVKDRRSIHPYPSTGLNGIGGLGGYNIE